MRAAGATERIFLAGDDPPAVQRAAQSLTVAGFAPTLASDELDDVAKRLPACDSATERWESVVFLVLDLAAIIAIGLAMFNAF
jgi:hypothetical protein